MKLRLIKQINEEQKVKNASHKFLKWFSSKSMPMSIVFLLTEC